MELAGHSADEVLTAIQNDLTENPEKGALVEGLGGIRKARAANPSRGKGKRGGLRFLYLYLRDQDHVHLLFLLDKNEQEDLSNEERRAIRQMAARLRKLGG